MKDQIEKTVTGRLFGLLVGWGVATAMGFPGAIGIGVLCGAIGVWVAYSEW